MKLFALAALLVASAAAQPTKDPKTFFAELPTAQPSQQLFQEALRVADKIATLSKAEAKDLLPVVFAAIKDDKDGTKHALLGLYAASRRPDSGELLKPHMAQIAALQQSPDPAFRATALHVLSNMQPQPPEAAGILFAIVDGTSGLNEKIDALSALSHISGASKERREAAAVKILGQPMDASTAAAAVLAAISPGASDELTDAVGKYLTHADWFVRFRAVLTLRYSGAAAVGRQRGAIAKLANDHSQPEPVKTVAQNTLDGKIERCVTLQSGPPPQFQPIPGCQ